jgi:hypothetical protein
MRARPTTASARGASGKTYPRRTPRHNRRGAGSGAGCLQRSETTAEPVATAGERGQPESSKEVPAEGGGGSRRRGAGGTGAGGGGATDRRGGGAARGGGATDRRGGGGGLTGAGAARRGDCAGRRRRGAAVAAEGRPAGPFRRRARAATAFRAPAARRRRAARLGAEPARPRRWRWRALAVGGNAGVAPTGSASAHAPAARPRSVASEASVLASRSGALLHAGTAEPVTATGRAASLAGSPPDRPSAMRLTRSPPAAASAMPAATASFSGSWRRPARTRPPRGPQPPSRPAAGRDPRQRCRRGIAARRPPPRPTRATASTRLARTLGAAVWRRRPGLTRMR